MRCFMSMKSFINITIITLLIFVCISLRDLKENYENYLSTRLQNIERTMFNILDEFDDVQNKSIKKVKYILQWTSPETVPFVFMGEGRSVFIESNCSFTNCYITPNRSFHSDITYFNAILFHGPELSRKSVSSLPERRSQHQKYVFVSIESSDYYPICSNTYDNFFNWTWTYKINSDAKWLYLIIRDSNNSVVGPSTDMHWMKLTEMNPVSSELKETLNNKTKAAAWFVSNCNSKSHREQFVAELQKYLKKFYLSVDIYGSCGPLKCPLEKEEECFKMLKTDYYFYLSFENSFAEDYVTEKLLRALQNDVVPIVFGGTNYTRFLPDGMYINARELGAEKLAEKMNKLILNPDTYAEYFRWKSHYSYHSLEKTAETDVFCNFCSMLNDKNLVKKTSTYSNFRDWWNPTDSC